MPKNTEHALAELEHRWQQIFERLAGGSEVPPAQRLRTEGYMEALVALGVATEPDLQDALERQYREAYGEALPGDWRELFPFPQVPGFGQRAPVYPSTGD
ncbi:MAG: hypothetical protein V2I66_09735 [Halieaceae bacterium]|jgi:hypothetical protein|nr:hypothetical protein [Halieaceae bacterium]